MRYQLIIFDWDGTLMDSGERIFNCFSATANDLGLLPPDREHVRSYIGLSLSEAWQRLYPDIDDQAVASLIARYRTYWIYLDKTPMPMFPGVMEGLARLKDAGYWLSVATGKARAGLDRVLDESELNPCFLYTRCADESRSKPHPQMLIDILDFTGLEANRAIMIGDTSFDLEMAKNANIDSMGVAYGYHDAGTLADLSTDRVSAQFKAGVAADFDEVVGFFLENKPNGGQRLHG